MWIYDNNGDEQNASANALGKILALSRVYNHWPCCVQLKCSSPLPFGHFTKCSSLQVWMLWWMLTIKWSMIQCDYIVRGFTALIEWQIFLWKFTNYNLCQRERKRQGSEFGTRRINRKRCLSTYECDSIFHSHLLHQMQNELYALALAQCG